MYGKLSKKNDETYGIFHMLVDPSLQHMENSFVIFLLSKNDFWAQLVSLHLGVKQTKSFQFTQPNLWTIPYVICVYNIFNVYNVYNIFNVYSVYNIYNIFFLRLPLTNHKNVALINLTYRDQLCHQTLNMNYCLLCQL